MNRYKQIIHSDMPFEWQWNGISYVLYSHDFPTISSLLHIEHKINCLIHLLTEIHPNLVETKKSVFQNNNKIKILLEWLVSTLLYKCSHWYKFKWSQIRCIWFLLHYLTSLEAVFLTMHKMLIYYPIQKMKLRFSQESYRLQIFAYYYNLKMQSSFI